MEGGERSHEGLGAIRGRMVFSFETAEGARYTINDSMEGARETENSVELVSVLVLLYSSVGDTH